MKMATRKTRIVRSRIEPRSGDRPRISAASRSKSMSRAMTAPRPMRRSALGQQALVAVDSDLAILDYDDAVDQFEQAGAVGHDHHGLIAHMRLEASDHVTFVLHVHRAGRLIQQQDGR